VEAERDLSEMSVLTDLTECDGVLPDTEAHVWHADLEMPASQVDSLYGLLDRAEQDRASRFRVRLPREEFVGSHAFLRSVLGKYLEMNPHEVQFQPTKNGKPELAEGGNLRFNLSHTQKAAVVALVRKRSVGVDVERIREDTEAMELAERFFSAAEVEWLRSQPPSETVSSFFTCWTAKEAYMKARGTGLSAPLSGFTVIPRAGDERLQLEIMDMAGQPDHWSVWQLDLGAGLRGALAVEGGAPDLRVRIGKWQWPAVVT
jgi:4'-phosphopantetheinyl transferase